jgi:hypothetical protein
MWHVWGEREEVNIWFSTLNQRESTTRKTGIAGRIILKCTFKMEGGGVDGIDLVQDETRDWLL